MKKEYCCCEIFLGKTLEAGANGISIISEKSEYITDGYHFVLQARAILNDGKRVIVMQQVITYCPWCGTELSKIISQHKNEVISFSEINKNLLNK